MKFRQVGIVTLVAGALVAGGQAAGAAADPSQTAAEAGASNMGVCSSFIGRLQVRDDVNLAIIERGEALGLSSPGELYRIRAQMTVDVAPEDECVKR